ncbi:MAG: CPBP family intramembrane metalloprotease [Oscillospiraceae bacterium]|nr:CPBP family intramembrane metalloprotease [Oscillospiraceae bacterium]
MIKCRFTDMKKACIISAFLFWGILLFLELGGNKTLAAVFPKELLSEYTDSVFYGAFLIILLIVLRQAFLSAIEDFKKNWQKRMLWTEIFALISFVLMVVSSIALEVFGAEKSINETAWDIAVAECSILQILAVCVSGPVVEEVFDRGILFEALRGKENRLVRNIAAVIISSVIFAFSHVSLISFSVGDMLGNIPIMMVGISFSVLYWKTGNVLCTILVHVVINIISVL